MSYRRVLSKYIESPESNPEVVFFYNDDIVVLKDAYPKARVHWLLMPRNIPAGWPLDVLGRGDFCCDSSGSDLRSDAGADGDSGSGSGSGPDFGSGSAVSAGPALLHKLKPWVTKFQKLAEAELKKYCKNDDHYDGLIRCGVHSVPSMDNLHIHIISKDMCSPALKRAQHYVSFTTKFFVDFNEIGSLLADDPRYNSQEMLQFEHKADLICVWCHRNFGRQFAALKRHLAEEYAERFNHTPSAPLLS